MGARVASGAKGTYQANGVTMPVVALEPSIDYAGKGPDDHTPWSGVYVRFWPIGGFGMVDVDAVQWEAGQ